MNISQDADDVALFAYVGEGASIARLTLKGSVSGRSRVAAFAANSAVKVDVDASDVEVTGVNEVAHVIAAGAGKDDEVITFESVPEIVNIIIGESSASESLGIKTAGKVVFDAGETGTEWSYDGSTGMFTVEKTADFKAGTVSF